MDKKKPGRLGLVITDGVGYRNFILSNFLKEASSNFDQVILYSGLPINVFDISSFSNVRLRELPVFRESFRTWFWRKAKEVAHLRLHNNFFGINDNYLANRSFSKTPRGLATRIIYNLTQTFHSERCISFFERRQLKSVMKEDITLQCGKYLEEDKSDLLFFTHQRPPFVIPLVAAAEKTGIQTCSFIFSWDNLSSKGRMAATFNSFLVWSDLMGKDLEYFYPNTLTGNIEVVGTPQFEPYVMSAYQMERENFLSKFNFDPHQKIICYSCGDISTSRNDELYIATIAKAVQNGQLEKSVNFIVRTSPAEDPDRFYPLEREYPFIRWNHPAWSLVREDHPETWSQRIPSKTDLRDLRSILEFSDLNINMCSTMSLDFMIFDKPVINPVFGNEQNGLYNDQRFLKYGHYEKVVRSGAVKVARDETELIDAINLYLQNPSADRNERRNLLNLQIGRPIEGTSRRIAHTLKQFCDS